jgi:hypothetical protein
MQLLRNIEDGKKRAFQGVWERLRCFDHLHQSSNETWMTAKCSYIPLRLILTDTDKISICQSDPKSSDHLPFPPQ